MPTNVGRIGRYTMRFAWKELTMSIQNLTDSKVEIDLLVTALEGNDPAVRQRARESLVALHSREVTAALVLELVDPRAHVRWEAAKALSDLGITRCRP